MKLKAEELKEIAGGGWTLGIIITAGVVFLIGVIDGYIRPLKCN